MNLHECLTLYTQEEVLSPEDTWYCSACQKHQQATKKFDLWRLPKVRLIIEGGERVAVLTCSLVASLHTQVLVVHLKRFQFSSTFRDKISSNVIFPLEGLDLSPYTVGPTLDRVYDLVAVSVRVPARFAGPVNLRNWKLIGGGDGGGGFPEPHGRYWWRTLHSLRTQQDDWQVVRVQRSIVLRGFG